MKFYLCFLFFAIGVCGDEVQNITASNAEKVVDTVVTGDLNTASGNIHTDSKYFRDKDGEYNYHGGNYNNSGSRFFSGNEETNYFRGKYGEYNYYGGNKLFGGNDEEILFNQKYAKDLYKAREDRRFRFDDGNPDVHGRIERPCQAYDTFCIRKFFAEHSHCKISGRAVPDPLFRAQTTFNIPNMNASETLINIEYSGLNKGRVAEFYINKVTDNLVIALDFDSVSFFSNNANLKFYHRGKEPTLQSDFVADTLLKLTITVVIPYLKDLRLDRAEISTYVSEPISLSIRRPGIGLNTDPEDRLQFASLFSNIPLDEQETLLTEGTFFATTFIQYNFCDFGLKDT